MAQPPLVIKDAKWGAIKRQSDSITVTDILSNLVTQRSGGRFLFINRAEKKSDLFGNVFPKQDKELWIRFTYNGEEKTESFHQDQEVLIGDAECYYQSLGASAERFGYIEDSVADALLFRHRPILVLHPNESSYPARVEWYLPQVSLYVMDVDGKGLRILEKVTDPAQLITTYTVGNYTFRSREKRRYFLKHNDTESIKNGEGPNKLATCPYYCTASVTEDGDICLTYFFFYAYNGPIMENPLVPAMVRSIAGTHQGDWEYVAIRVSPDGEDIRAVHMSRHTGAEGKWYLAACPDANRDAGWHIDSTKKRIVVFPGCESHANYNVPGRQDRGHGGFVDDKCGLGPVWDPDYIVNLGSVGRPRVPWAMYSGIWGKPQESKLEGGGPEGPCLKSAFWGATFPMKGDNCIPAFGSWWTDMQKAGNERINAAGKSLIRKDRPAGGVILPPNVHLSNDSHDTSDISEVPIGDMAAIPVPGAAASTETGRGMPEARGMPEPRALGDAPKPISQSLTSLHSAAFTAAVIASTQAPAFAARGKRGDMLDSSEQDASSVLEHDNFIVSSNDEYRLWMQSDGNLVLYEKANGGAIIWSSNARNGDPPFRLVCQADGNCVIYDCRNRSTWKTDTFDKSPKGPYHFVIQNDRNLVLYDRINRAVWAAGSNKPKGSSMDYGLLIKR